VCLLPGVVAIELMARAAALLAPALEVVALEKVELQRAVKVRPGKPATVRVCAERASTPGATTSVAVQVESDVRGPDGKLLVDGRVHFQGTARLAGERLSAPPMPASRGNGVGAIPSVTLYGADGLLPHGPSFQTVASLDEVADDGGKGTVVPTNGVAGLPGTLLTAPLAREAGFQVAGLHGMLRLGAFAIPRGCSRIELYGPAPERVRLEARVVLRAASTEEVEYDIDVYGDDGRLYDRMIGYRAARLEQTRNA
jgi:hypothetical protein